MDETPKLGDVGISLVKLAEMRANVMWPDTHVLVTVVVPGKPFIQTTGPRSLAGLDKALREAYESWKAVTS